MKYSQQQSLLTTDQWRMDRGDDLLCAADIKEAGDRIHACITRLDSEKPHPNGCLTGFAKKVGSAMLSGWYLDTPPKNDTNYVVASALSSEEREFKLITMQYRPGIKARLAKQGISLTDGCHVERTAIEELSIIEFPDFKFTGHEKTLLQNAPISGRVDVNPEIKNQEFDDTVKYYFSLSQYSLLKIDTILRIFEADTIA